MIGDRTVLEVSVVNRVCLRKAWMFPNRQQKGFLLSDKCDDVLITVSTFWYDALPT